MRNFSKRHFPSDRKKFKLYFRYFMPIVMGAFLWALNGVVDNFMVGQIDQGVTALSAVNQWSMIIMGWFIATSAAGGVVMSQLYHDGKLKEVKKISTYRFFICFIFVIPFIIIAFVSPNLLISVFFEEGKGAENIPMNEEVYKNGREYLEIIAFQWILMAFSFNMGNQFAELGHGKYRMYFGVGTLSLNIFLNAMLMYVAKYGVRGAAIASAAARVLFIILSLVVITKNKIPISYNIFKIAHVGKNLQKIYWKRWVYILSVFTVSSFISFRAFFYSKGYPLGSLGDGVSATSVLGLAGAWFNIFTVAFGALASMSAIFVSSELGKGNYKEAKINANELKGFNTFMAILFTIPMFIFASLIPYMKFLSENQFDAKGELTFDSDAQLIRVRNSLYVLSTFYPLWIWFSTSYRNANAGGKGGHFGAYDWFMTGPIQLSWLAILMLLIVPSSSVLQDNFAITYAIFFSFDIFKAAGMEYLYYRNDKWLYSITKSEMNSKK